MSVIEIYELFIMYSQFSYNLDILYFNMIYNAGSVIKGISNIVMYFYAKEYTRVADGFTLGLELGQIIWMIFYPTAEYLSLQVRNGIPFRQDYTWGALLTLNMDGYDEVLPFSNNAEHYHEEDTTDTTT